MNKVTPEKAKNIAIRYAMVWVMLLIIAFFSYKSARFATLDNLQNIMIAAAPFALIALGQTLVILTGGIDLSPGSTIAVAAMTGAWVSVTVQDNWWLPIVAAILAGTIVGCINGFLVANLNLPPFIATLGTMTAASGVAYAIGGGAPINGLPESYGWIANTRFLGLTIPVIAMIIGIVVLAIVMKRTVFGMQVYAVGGNPEAAGIAGIRTKWVLFRVYATAGLLAGISGLMLSSRVISGPPSLGQGFELDSIAAVVIGGASLLGGRGTVWGTALGLLLMQTLNNGLDILTVPTYWQSVVKGLLIVAAVSVDVWSTKRRQDQ